jgi:hypothetical protein
MKKFLIPIFLAIGIGGIFYFGIVYFLDYRSDTREHLPIVSSYTIKDTVDSQSAVFYINSKPFEQGHRFVVIGEKYQPYLLNNLVIVPDEKSIQSLFDLDTKEQNELRMSYSGEGGSMIDREERFRVDAKIRLTPGQDYYTLSIEKIVGFETSKGWCPEGLLC